MRSESCVSAGCFVALVVLSGCFVPGDAQDGLACPCDPGWRCQDAVCVPGAETDAGMCQVGEAGDPCVSIPMLPIDPLIDGVVDCGLALVPVARLGWSGRDPVEASGVTAEFGFAWRPSGMYVAVQVHDPDRFPAAPGERLWHGDAVEVYLDSDGVFASDVEYDYPGTTQLTVSAPPSDELTSQRGTRSVGTGREVPVNWVTGDFGAFPTEDGYLVEMFVRAAEFDLGAWELASGARVALDVSVLVSTVDGSASALHPGQLRGQFYHQLAPTPPPDNRPQLRTDAFCVSTIQ